MHRIRARLSEDAEHTSSSHLDNRPPVSEKRRTTKASEWTLRMQALHELSEAAALHEPIGALLQRAALAVRPDARAYLCHLEDRTLVVDATVGTKSPAAGTTRVLDRARCATLARRTRAWSPDRNDGNAAGCALDEALGERAMLNVPMHVGAKRYFISFAGELETYEVCDLAFVETLVALIARRLTADSERLERMRLDRARDPLTGLANRTQFRQALRGEIAGGRFFAIAFVDIDGFRHINEYEGYQIGDDLLVRIAAELSAVAGTDLVTRTSGDEFGILLRGAATVADAERELARYTKLFERPFQSVGRDGSRKLAVAASFGVACFPSDAATSGELMRRAGVALDLAKTRGGSATLFFDRPMERILEEAHVHVTELAEAIASDQLAVVYQPTFDLASRTCRGAEALVRWDHPERGRLSPAEFIATAERNGLIAPLSRWVLERIVRDLEIRDALPPGFRIYMNVSARLLDDVAFVTSVRETLVAHPGLAERLGIEVTETAAMENVERSINTIDIFRAWGLKVAIDDFGTGYSSLAYLKRLTVDVIKIDRSFVNGLPDDERDCALTEMLLRISERFGFVTLAEGIETEAQAAWLFDHGCGYGQGYLVAKPASFGALLARLGIAPAHGCVA